MRSFYNCCSKASNAVKEDIIASTVFKSLLFNVNNDLKTCWPGKDINSNVLIKTALCMSLFRKQKPKEDIAELCYGNTVIGFKKKKLKCNAKD